MKDLLSLLLRLPKKRVACDELLPLDDAWLRRAAANALVIQSRLSTHSHA